MVTGDQKALLKEQCLFPKLGNNIIPSQTRHQLS